MLLLFTHCLKDVIGGSYVNTLCLRVIAVELVDINTVPDGDETFCTFVHCHESFTVFLIIMVALYEFTEFSAIM